MKISVKELREKYPSPVASITKDGYCVGGALCLELNEMGKFTADRFPIGRELCDALIVANPNLYSDDAMDYANLITRSNDAGKFEEAWQMLETALTYDSKKL